MGNAREQVERTLLTPDTIIEARMGMQSVRKKWSALAFENIGALNPMLLKVKADLEHRGVSEWEGFTLTVA